MNTGLSIIQSTARQRLLLPIIACFLLIFLVTSAYSAIHPSDTLKLGKQASFGTAIAITGAASRIPQEAALLEHLYKTGWMKNVSFISGASSGALNCVMLNAILSGKFNWERYKQILFSINNNKIYKPGDRKLPFSTVPLRQFLSGIIKDTLGYSTIGDLPIPSSISATSLKLLPLRNSTLRFSNRGINSESSPYYDLVELLMASTAIPVVFPAEKINGNKEISSMVFLDGGIGDDHIPLEAVLQYQSMRHLEADTLIIVSRKSDSEDDLKSELYNLGLRDTKLLEKLGLTLERYSKDSFIRKLMEFQLVNPELASHTYIYIPDFKQNFPLLNFDTMEDQYSVTSNWADNHQPVLLSDYLKHNLLSTNKIPAATHEIKK
ncbi:MAG: patatin-like phospholipase family protein [Bacteroidetes bacterium]|nr:patatin-like phospholipase family protein [Bacteroidota bacterium]